MVRVPPWLLLVLLAWGCAAHKTPRTELVLVADTNIPDVDTIRFEVSGSGRSEMAEASVQDGEPLTLGVVRDKGSLGPITVSAHGLHGDAEIISRTAIVSFVVDKTLVVTLHLVQSCRGVSCKVAEQSCTEHGCAAEMLDPASLPEWDGSVPGLARDAGVEASDAHSADASIGAEDAAQPAVDASNGAEDAAQPAVDASTDFADCGGNARNVDLMSNVENCGACKNMCKAAGRNTVAVCTAGACGTDCRLLTGDCDGDPSNGCEQSLVVADHCGACDTQCMNNTACWLGVCR